MMKEIQGLQAMEDEAALKYLKELGLKNGKRIHPDKLEILLQQKYDALTANLATNIIINSKYVESILKVRDLP